MGHSERLGAGRVDVKNPNCSERKDRAQSFELVPRLGATADDGCARGVLAGTVLCGKRRRAGRADTCQRNGVHHSQWPAVLRVRHHDNALDRGETSELGFLRQIDVDLRGKGQVPGSSPDFT